MVKTTLPKKKAEKMIKIVDGLVIKKSEIEKMRSEAEKKISTLRKSEQIKQRLEEIKVPALKEIKD